jgi:hypothetical protein
MDWNNIFTWQNIGKAWAVLLCLTAAENVIVRLWGYLFRKN